MLCYEESLLWDDETIITLPYYPQQHIIACFVFFISIYIIYFVLSLLFVCLFVLLTIDAYLLLIIIISTILSLLPLSL